ncbi:unnamed protein product [Ceutorhynchus assimilis]|uniref:Golgin subfamily A conserved domain-containing protein n=1 Tax=Ceutorhynchus assimilis TaxID=467358 RepID=A0A9N9MQ20_9CUCU|nr:unnamed protein product [Ceutorhynchus assimilis]
MADVGAEADKKVKLANTKKRFKQLQELKKKRNEDQDTNKSPETISEVPGTSSEHSSYRNSPVIPNTQNEPVIDHWQQEPTLPNYFEPQSQTPAAFFDTLPSKNEEPIENPRENPSLLTYFNTSSRNTVQNVGKNLGLPKYFDNFNTTECMNVKNDEYKLFPREAQRESSNSFEPEDALPDDYPGIKENSELEDVTCMEYPDVKQIKMGQHARRSSSGTVTLDYFLAGQNENLTDSQVYPNSVFSARDDKRLMEYLGTTGVTQEDQNNISHTNHEIDDSTDLTQKEIRHSNVESLRQLSDQLAHMIEPDYEYSSASGPTTDFEKRNIELADNLAKEKLHSAQLEATNTQLQSHINQLQDQLTKQQFDSNSQTSQEVAHLKNELQTHLQTIGLLVAEKTELSSNLSQYEINCNQKTSECEELQARLKASRSRVADLEREVNNLKSEKIQTQNAGEQYNTSLVNLKQEYINMKEQKDELAQDLMEVREKLKNTLEENVKMQQEYKEMAGKLSLAEIKIQQLLSGDSSGMDTQIEHLTQEKFSLESDKANLNQMLKSIVKERDESTVQFQQYAQQLNAQISHLSSKLEQLQQEKENLLMQEQNRIKHIGELERQLQNLQKEQVTYASRNSSNSDVRNELERARELCAQLNVDQRAAEENLTKVTNEKDLLLKELEAKNDSISQLESMIEQLRGNQPDSVKLLATMESDKVAAARAIEQNKELKQQLESMQEVFMKMDNDKVVLTENLKGQHETNKDLIEKLQKTEITLQSLADAIEIKDKELTHLREAFEEMNRQSLHHEQLEDRLRHYEAHDNSAHVLQNDLQEAKQVIVKLTNQLNKKKDEENNTPLEIQLNDANQTILELTNEVNKLKIPDTTEQDCEETKDDIDENTIDKENAMKYLEEKVKKTMQEIADLTDEKQRLEHIVLQLQGETETIGEYVALYQHQRMILKQKAQEKDQQLKQLAGDREQIKLKIDRLNELIKKLVLEKGSIPAELMQHHELMSNICEEHSKLNAQSNIIEPENEQENVETSQTAEEIISLLTEIKTSNLVQPSDNIHPCPWCSGQLMTV